MSLFFRLVISVLAIFPTLSHAVSTSNSNFTLYAYGGDIGGLPIMYQGGYAYMYNGTVTANSTLTSIYFAESTVNSTNTFVAKVNKTASPNATFASETLALPASGSSGPVSFVSGTTSTGNATVPNLLLNGGTVFVVSDTGELETPFYAEETDKSGLWSLMWDISDASDVTVTSVTLRTVAQI